MKTIAMLFLLWITAVSYAAEPERLKVFDGTLFMSKPGTALKEAGFCGITIAYGLGENSIVKARPGVLAAADEARKAAKVVVLDIERWPVIGDSEPARASLEFMNGALDLVHQRAPGVAVGIYGIPPVRNYRAAIAGPKDSLYRAWTDQNRQLADLGRRADAIFPSLYTFYDDVEGWVRYATETIREARRYGKPVYPFLWPNYQNADKPADQYIGARHWQTELETVAQQADGLVIWGGWDGVVDRPQPWDGSASWWKVTKGFLDSLSAEGRLAACNRLENKQ